MQSAVCDERNDTDSVEMHPQGQDKCRGGHMEANMDCFLGRSVGRSGARMDGRTDGRTNERTGIYSRRGTSHGRGRPTSGCEEADMTATRPTCPDPPPPGRPTVVRETIGWPVGFSVRSHNATTPTVGSRQPEMT